MFFIKQIREHTRLITEIISGEFTTVHKRPITAIHTNLWSEPIKKTRGVAVVMQGPLIAANNFTLETIKIYKKTFFPDTIIIVSTWHGENEGVLGAIKKRRLKYSYVWNN